MARFAGAMLVTVCPTVYAGQTPPAPQTPVFTSGLDLVRMDVRIVGDDGRPLKDVRRDEIEVVDEGTERPILLFQHVEQPDGTYADAALRTIAAEVSTNQGAPRGNLYILAFDQAHIAAGTEQRARRAAAQFLRTRVGPGDRVALYALPGPGPQIDFSSDVAHLLATLPSVRGSLERTGVGVLGTMRVNEAYEIVRGNEEVLSRIATSLAAAEGSSDAVGTVVQRQSDDPKIFTRLVREDARTIVEREDAQARQMLLRLTEVIRGVKDIEGRKAVVLLSEGFFADHVTREMEMVAAAAAQSYSAVYALDLNTRDIDLKQVSGSGGEQFGEIQSRIAPLASLAAETDGLFLNNANTWLDRAFDRASDQSRDFYIVGFEPPPGARRHRADYRRVTIKVKRRGAHVNVRSGYSLSAPAAVTDVRRSIDAALKAPFPQQALPLEYTTYALRGTEAGRLRVVVSLAADLPVAPPDSTAAAQIVFVVRHAKDGRTVASGSDRMLLPAEPRPGATTGTVNYRVQFELPAGEYRMRVVVREPGGVVGSADRRFTLRRLDGEGLTAGDLILGSAGSDGLPVRAHAFAADALEGTLEVYAGSPQPLDDVDVKVELIPVGAGTPVASVHATLLDVRADKVGARREARVLLPLGSIAPGNYIARAVVRNADGEVAERLRDVRVSAGAPPPVAPRAPAAPPSPAQIVAGELARQYTRDVTQGGTPAVRRAADLIDAMQWTRGEAALAADATAAADVLRGLARFAAGDAARAAEAFERRLAAEPRDARAAFFLGWVHAATGDERRAIGAWRNAVFLDPTLTPAHLALADAYLRLAQPALALQAVRAGLSALPNSPELLGRLSRLERHDP